MSLASAVKAGPPSKRKGPSCSVGVLLSTLPESEARGLMAMLAPDSGWTGADMAAALRAELGIDFLGTTLSRHRRGDCRCDVPR